MSDGIAFHTFIERCLSRKVGTVTLQQLHYIIEVARYGSISEAAEKLFVTQPSITTAIRNIENEFGIEIFSRSAKGVETTNDGEAFLCYAKQVLEQETLMREHFFGNHSTKKTIFSISSQHYSFVIKAFYTMLEFMEPPHYTIDLVETQTREVIDNVASGKSELGILYLNDNNTTVLKRIIESNDVEFLEFAALRIHVILSANHPCAKLSSICLEDLMDYPYIVYFQGGNSNYFAEKTIDRMRFPKNILVNDRATLEELIRHSNCFTVGPKILDCECRDKQIVALPLNNEQFVQIVVLRKRNIQMSEMGKRYLEALKNVLKEYIN